MLLNYWWILCWVDDNALKVDEEDACLTQNVVWTFLPGKVSGQCTFFVYLDDPNYFFAFFWLAPLGGVMGRPELRPPYGNFFLSAGCNNRKNYWKVFFAYKCKILTFL